MLVNGLHITGLPQNKTNRKMCTYVICFTAVCVWDGNVNRWYYTDTLCTGTRYTLTFDIWGALNSHPKCMRYFWNTYVLISLWVSAHWLADYQIFGLPRGGICHKSTTDLGDGGRGLCKTNDLNDDWMVALVIFCMPGDDEYMLFIEFNITIDLTTYCFVAYIYTKYVWGKRMLAC